MAFFAVQVRTGQELKAKEMIKYLLKSTNLEEANLVKSIYALETYTEYVNSQDKSKLNLSKITEKDILTKLQLDFMNEGVSNLTKQYEAVEKYTDDNYVKFKQSIKEKIKKLKNNIDEIRNKSKKLKALFPGYILIELKTNSDYLPDSIWHLIHKCPVVVCIPNKYNIPAEEIYKFFEKAETVPEIEVQFEEVLEYKEVIRKQKDLVHVANTTKDIQKEKEYLQRVEELDRDVVSEVNKLKESSNAMVDRIKAFIKNKKECVIMPVSLFYELYKEFKGKEILPQITSIEFISRLQQIIRSRSDKKMVLE